MMRAMERMGGEWIGEDRRGAGASLGLDSVRLFLYDGGNGPEWYGR